MFRRRPRRREACGWPGMTGLARGPSRFIPLGLPVPVRGPGLREVVQERSAHRGLLGEVAEVLSGFVCRVLAAFLDEDERIAVDDGDDLGVLADQGGHALQGVTGEGAAGTATGD